MLVKLPTAVRKRRWLLTSVFILLVFGYMASKNLPNGNIYHHQLKTAQYGGETNGIQTTTQSNSCLERKHVVYIRIPKTGSSTMTFIIWRFGLTKGLRFLLPRVNYEGSQSQLTADKFYLPKSGKYCDVMAVHVEYSYDNITPYFPKDLAFVSLLREPMKQLYSTIYYIQNIKNKIPGENKLDSYLRDPEIYEDKHGRSFTHNPMASYFGTHKEDFFNIEKIKDKINELEERFEMILILEKLDESLVLLKRKLCWKMSDILYKSKNRNKRKPTVQITQEDVDKLKTWSQADYIIYEHFSTKLQIEIQNGGEEFQEELTIFRKILNKTSSFCESYNQEDSLLIERTTFSAQFEINASYCNLMRSGGPKLLDRIRRSQNISGFCNISSFRRKKIIQTKYFSG